MPTYTDLIKLARELYNDAGIEIDDDAPVRPEKTGAMVQAWIWVPYEEEEVVNER